MQNKEADFNLLERLKFAVKPVLLVASPDSIGRFYRPERQVRSAAECEKHQGDVFNFL